MNEIIFVAKITNLLITMPLLIKREGNQQQPSQKTCQLLSTTFMLSEEKQRRECRGPLYLYLFFRLPSQKNLNR